MIANWRQYSVTSLTTIAPIVKVAALAPTWVSSERRLHYGEFMYQHMHTQVCASDCRGMLDRPLYARDVRPPLIGHFFLHCRGTQAVVFPAVTRACWNPSAGVRRGSRQFCPLVTRYVHAVQGDVAATRCCETLSNRFRVHPDFRAR
jgi:hypothetical protein